MSLPVSLQSVIDEMDMQNDLFQVYINRKTGEMIGVSEEDEMTIRWIESGKESLEDLPRWQQDIIPKITETLNSEDFIALPSQFEIHEYAIMEQYCYTVEDPAVKDDLLNAIRGRGAFRRFKDRVFYHGIRDEWFSFKKSGAQRNSNRFFEG